VEICNFSGSALISLILMHTSFVHVLLCVYLEPLDTTVVQNYVSFWGEGGFECVFKTENTLTAVENISTP